MKKLLYIIIAASFVTGCSKKLDKFPQGALTDETVFTEPGDYTLAIDGAYVPLTNRQRGNWDWNDGGSIPREWVVGDVMAGDAVKGGGSLGDQEPMRRMQTFSIFSDNDNPLGIWRYNYKGITSANDILSKDGKILDAATWKRINGEAHFLRAFYYFRLVVNFGGVPLLAPDKGLKNNTTRGTVDETYALIENDLQAAIDNLPESYDAANYQRATKGAAIALLAKTYLYRQRWQDCLTQIAKLPTRYGLLANFADNFNGVGEQGNEAIFVARHDAGVAPSQGSVLNAVFGPNGKGWNFNQPTKDLVNEFEPGDPRLNVTVFKPGDNWLDGTPYNSAGSLTGYNVKKFMSNTNPIDDGGVDFIYIRYADVLLWKAECYAQLNQLTDAKTALEQVRARARSNAANPATALPPVTATSHAAILSAIYHERRVELAFEWHRYYDLVRWGLAKTVLAADPNADPLTGYKDYGNGWQDKNKLLPIPQRETSLLGISQNTGY